MDDDSSDSDSDSNPGGDIREESNSASSSDSSGSDNDGKTNHKVVKNKHGIASDENDSVEKIDGSSKESKKSVIKKH